MPPELSLADILEGIPILLDGYRGAVGPPQERAYRLTLIAWLREAVDRLERI